MQVVGVGGSLIDIVAPSEGDVRIERLVGASCSLGTPPGEVGELVRMEVVEGEQHGMVGEQWRPACAR